MRTFLGSQSRRQFYRKSLTGIQWNSGNQCSGFKINFLRGVIWMSEGSCVMSETVQGKLLELKNLWSGNADDKTVCFNGYFKIWSLKTV